MARGSAIQRTVTYFREAPLDEARAAYMLVHEVMEQRLQPKPATTPRRTRTRRRKLEEQLANQSADNSARIEIPR